MTTATATSPTAGTTVPRKGRLTFTGVLRSEFIKLWSLRSTYWCCAIVIVLSVGFVLLLSSIQRPSVPGAPAAAALSASAQQVAALADATIGVGIGQLVFSVLGVLAITGEYSTGMIRSTLTAEPKRLPTLIGKAAVLAVSSFVVGLITLFGTAAIIFPILPGIHIHPNWGDSNLVFALFGGAAYIALITLLAFSIGAIIRSTAGGIASAIGLVLVVPAVLGILSNTTGAKWLSNIVVFLPTQAGRLLYSYGGPKGEITNGYVTLNSTEGGLVLLAWFVVPFVIAAILLMRRDA
jgi:ABC-2 type transport system permease protein